MAQQTETTLSELVLPPVENYTDRIQITNPYLRTMNQNAEATERKIIGLCTLLDGVQLKNDLSVITGEMTFLSEQISKATAMRDWAEQQLCCQNNDVIAKMKSTEFARVKKMYLFEFNVTIEHLERLYTQMDKMRIDARAQLDRINTELMIIRQ